MEIINMAKRKKVQCNGGKHLINTFIKANLMKMAVSLVKVLTLFKLGQLTDP